MSVVITLDDIRAYAEVDYIIKHMNQKYIDKVPEKLRKFFAEYKDPTYEVKINPYIPLDKQGLKKYTLEIVAVLHLRYWCEDETRKKELYELMIGNQEKIEKEINEKYNINNIFADDFEDEKEDESFSKPRVIQKYEVYSKENEDIKDYTDYEESESSEELVSQDNLKKKNIFEIIKEKIISIFRKNK